MREYDSADYRKYTFKSELDKSLHTLEGILRGIAFDRKINDYEIEELKNWCLINNKYIAKHPYNELIPLIERALSDGELCKDEVQDILWVCNNFVTENNYYDIVTSDIQRLQGILHGIMSDNQINEEEIKELWEWLNENDHLASTYPYDEVYSLVMSVLSDGKLDESEVKILKAFFSDFIDLKASCNININEINNLKTELNISGICAVCPEVKFEDMSFCFTGASSKTTRSKIKNIVEALNGVFHDNVIKSTNYLVVGDNGNPCWAFSCYGRKVEKAVKLRKTGYGILIIHENDFWDAVNDL